MFKLLPEKKRRLIEREYKLRLATLMLAGICLILSVAVAGILPSYFLSIERLSEVRQRATQQSQAPVSEDEAVLPGWLSRVNRRISLLGPQEIDGKPFEQLKNVLDEKIEGVMITSLSWKLVGNEERLKMRGVARDRQTLVNFSNKINASKKFSRVELPVSNFAEDQDINFEISLFKTQQ